MKTACEGSVFSARLADELVILGMRSNPEPHETVRAFDRDCSIVKTDAYRPKPTDLLEV